MTIARRLKWYLDSHNSDYQLVAHSHSDSSLESAETAHVSPGAVAKPVLLEDERGYMLAIVPADRRISIAAIGRALSRRFELASESELDEIFFDCETGAVPPVGLAYGVPSVIDDSLLTLDEVYFEAGDHEDLVRMRSDEFFELIGEPRHATLCAAH